MPVTASVCGEPPAALSATVIDPVRVPPRLGENCTPIRQCCPLVSVVPVQPSLTTANSVEFVDATDVTARLPVPVFVTLKFCVALVVCTFCVLNVSVDGFSAAAGPVDPAVPVSVMTCVPGLPESVSVSVADNAPLVPARGVNVNEMEQVERAANVLPQLLVPVKSPRFVPPST